MDRVTVNSLQQTVFTFLAVCIILLTSETIPSDETAAQYTVYEVRGCKPVMVKLALLPTTTFAKLFCDMMKEADTFEETTTIVPQYTEPLEANETVIVISDLRAFTTNLVIVGAFLATTTSVGEKDGVAVGTSEGWKEGVIVLITDGT